MKRFFYIDDSGKRKGPYTIEQLKEHYLFENTLVWTDGLEKWIAAGKVHVLQAIINQPPPPLDLIDTGEIESVTIGTRVWMKKNLDVSHFRNGDPIHEAKTDEEWQKAGEKGKPAWCFYNNDPELGQHYGRLYNWFAVNDHRGLALKGWHIPTDTEWTKLIDFLGGWKVASTTMNRTRDNDNYENRFAGLLGGKRDADGSFGILSVCGFWWSSSEHSAIRAWHIFLSRSDVGRYHWDKAFGFSVRCLKDKVCSEVD